jgi:hypothetical protein
MPRTNDSGSEGHAMGLGKCSSDTEKALLVVIDGKNIWVPKSVVHDDSEVYKVGDEGELLVKRWWAEKNGHG